MKTVEIISFEPQHSDRFHDLNVDWLEKYFYVEPYDRKVLSNPKEYIIDTGGFIFFARLNGKIVGTVALIKQEEFYELSKMAVTPNYQGYKIGQQLMDHCINFAREQGWHNIILYSHRKLVPAITLYEKVGFVEIALEENSHYERSNIKMEFVL